MNDPAFEAGEKRSQNKTGDYLQNTHQVLPTLEAPWQVLQDQRSRIGKDQWRRISLGKMGVMPMEDSVIKMASRRNQEDTCDKERARIWLIAPSSPGLLREGQMLAGRIGIAVGWQNAILGSSAVPNTAVCIYGSQSTKDRVTRTHDRKENINTNQHLTPTRSYLMPLASERETSRFLFCRGLLT